MVWQLYVISSIFCIAGIFHLWKPKIFMRVMPLYIPYHKSIVYISGIVEIILGIGLLFSSLRIAALWGIFILLIFFLPVHIHMLVNKKAGLNLPKTLLVFRFILQFVFMYWLWILLHTGDLKNVGL